MRVFLDTNIILDVLVPDRKSASSSSIIFQQVKQGKLEAFVATQSIIDTYYISSQFDVKKEEADHLTLWMTAYLNIRSITEADIRSALRIASSDFEDDALLTHAEIEQCDIFVTNDKKILKRNNLGPMRIMRPEQFVELMSLS